MLRLSAGPAVCLWQASRGAVSYRQLRVHAASACLIRPWLQPAACLHDCQGCPACASFGLERSCASRFTDEHFISYES
jgi:hypothetical protein